MTRLVLRAIRCAVAIGTASSAFIPAAARAQSRDVVALASSDAELATWAKAIEVSGLAEMLRGRGPFTVLAPSDDAFARLQPGQLDRLMADRDKLRRVVLYHVIEGRWTVADLAKLTSARTLAGIDAPVSGGARVRIGNGRVDRPNLAASNGLVHVVDAVLSPPGTQVSSRYR
jgi:uncharacterized surface protein with fasciclin (FAS1) repeats